LWCRKFSSFSLKSSRNYITWGCFPSSLSRPSCCSKVLLFSVPSVPLLLNFLCARQRGAAGTPPVLAGEDA
jgi:hypothetical protein